MGRTTSRKAPFRHSARVELRGGVELPRALLLDSTEQEGIAAGKQEPLSTTRKTWLLVGSTMLIAWLSLPPQAGLAQQKLGKKAEASDWFQKCLDLPSTGEADADLDRQAKSALGQ